MLHTKQFLPTRAIYYSRRLRRDFYFYRAMRWRHQDGPISPHRHSAIQQNSFCCRVVEAAQLSAFGIRSTAKEKHYMGGKFWCFRLVTTLSTMQYRSECLPRIKVGVGETASVKMAAADDVMCSLFGSRVRRIMEICWKLAVTQGRNDSRSFDA